MKHAASKVHEQISRHIPDKSLSKEALKNEKKGRAISASAPQCLDINSPWTEKLTFSEEATLRCPIEADFTSESSNGLE